MNYPHNTEIKPWSKEEIDYLKKQCSLGILNYEEMGKTLGRSQSSMENKAYKLGIRNFHKSNKKHSENSNFWIPNPISCYFAGFSTADAYVKKYNDNRGFYRLELSQADESVLEKLKKYSSYTGEIKRSLRCGKFVHSRLVISNPQWLKDLENYYSIVQNKTKRLRPPNIDDEYLKWCFFTGYVDGDGTITIDKRNKCIYVSMVSISPEVINWCFDMVLKKFGNVSHYKKARLFKPFLCYRKYHKFSITGLRAAVLIDFINRFNLPTLDRKWKNPEILEIIELQKQKYPHFFTTPLPPLNYTISDNIKYA